MGYKGWQILEEYGLKPEPYIKPTEESYEPARYYFYAVEELKKGLARLTRQSNPSTLVITDSVTDSSTGATGGTPPEGWKLPRELDTPEARKYFARAIERGWINPTATGFKWVTIGERGGNAQLGYFLNRIYPQPRPITALEKYFGVAKLSTYLTNADLEARRADVLRWRTDIDSIFSN